MHHGTTLTWQSREGSYDFADSFPTKGRVLRDCTPRALPRASRLGRHVGLWPPRNDKPGGVAPMNLCQQILPACKALPERRYIFLSRGGLVQRAPLQTQSVHTILTVACSNRQHCAGPGCPLPYNGVRGRSVRFIGSPSIPEKFSAICKIGACFFRKNRYNNIHKTMLQGVGTVR